MKARNGILLLLMICGLGYLFGFLFSERLDKNSVNTVGRIQSVRGSSKGGGVLVDFSFMVGEREVDRTSTILFSQPFSSRDFKFLIGKRLSVVYERDNPNNSKMLFLPLEYEKYKVKMVDSIKPIIDSIYGILNK